MAWVYLALAIASESVVTLSLRGLYDGLRANLRGTAINPTGSPSDLAGNML